MEEGDFEGFRVDFTESFDALAVDGSAGGVGVAHEECAKLAEDGSLDGIALDPLFERVGFNVAKLFHRQLLHECCVSFERWCMLYSTNLFIGVVILLVLIIDLPPSALGE